jgi:hypothetical protein
MSNVPNVNRDSGFAKQPKLKNLTPRPAPAKPKPVRLAKRDPRHGFRGPRVRSANPRYR